ERGADNREIRRPTRLGTICKIAEANIAEVIAVIEVFRRAGRSFLMPPTGTSLHEECVIDISHESLIRNWERLKVWVDEEAQSARIYRRLSDAAVLHREGEEALLQNPALQSPSTGAKNHIQIRRGPNATIRNSKLRFPISTIRSTRWKRREGLS